MTEELQALTGKIIGAAIAVHRELGPGLLETVYEACLAHELKERGLTVERQKVLPVRYKGIQLDAGYRLDFVVEHEVVLELKATKSLEPLDQAQLLTYLKLSGYPLGLLINFNVPVLVQGVKRMINGHRERFPDPEIERPEDRWLRQRSTPSAPGGTSPSTSAD